MSDLAALALPVEEICACCETQPIERLSLFCSALRDKLTAESDIDLLVEYLPTARIGYFELAQQEIYLGEVIGKMVDLRTPNVLSRLFRQDVVDNAGLLYARGS